MKKALHALGIGLVFALSVFLHYPEAMHFAAELSIASFLGLERHAVERTLLLIPIIYAGGAFGLAAGAAALGAAAAAMLPRVFIYSAFPRDALFETCLVLAVGALVVWWQESRRRDAGRCRAALLKERASRRALGTQMRLTKQHSRRMSALYGVSAAISQAADADDVLSATVDRIREGTRADCLLVYIVNEEEGSVRLGASSGDRSDAAPRDIRYGHGVLGGVAKSGDERVFNGPSDGLRRETGVEGIRSAAVVALTSESRVWGVLCAVYRHAPKVEGEDQRMLRVLGLEIGLALQRLEYLGELRMVSTRFREVFEKAQDAIWIQDSHGIILRANTAAAKLSGYALDELIGTAMHTVPGEPATGTAQTSRVVTRDGRELDVVITTGVLDADDPPSVLCIARDVTEDRRLRESLRAYAGRIAGAHEEERARMARELHDDTVQALVAISRRNDLALGDSEGDPALRLHAVQSEIDDVLSRMRRILHDLRPPALELLGLVPAVRQLARTIREAGIEAECTSSGETARLAPEHELLVFRIVQEAVSNVIRHARASRAQLGVRFKADGVHVTVWDNGVGFESERLDALVNSGRLGLMGMRERALLLGGDLRIESTQGGGTTITLEATALLQRHRRHAPPRTRDPPQPEDPVRGIEDP